MAARRKQLAREGISSIPLTMGKPWSKFDWVQLIDGLLFRSFEIEKGDDQQRNEALGFTHDIPGAGHLSSRRLNRKVIKKIFYWPNWETGVEISFKNCQKCMKEMTI